MQKAKQYDWKDSNMALFGSDTEKEVSAITLICSSSLCWGGIFQQNFPVEWKKEKILSTGKERG